MRFFGLTPDRSTAAGASAAALGPPRSCGFSIFYGGLSLGAVSALAYSIWAYSLVRGTAAMYTAIAAVYLGLGGIALSRLVRGAGAWKRFAPLFALVFFAYAVAWCAFWFGLRGRHHADLWGSAVGLAAVAFLLLRAFGQRWGFLACFGVLFAFHTFGYYLGESLYGAVRGSTGRLLWGAAHGVGFGTGLGYVLFHCQTPPAPHSSPSL
jgi:hypothetical protein